MKSLLYNILSHSIHGTGIFACISHKIQPNVGKHTSPMDGMGYVYNDRGECL